MPQGSLNNVATSDAYTDAVTVQFPYARKGFTLNVFNAAVFYQVGTPGPGGRDVVWEPTEHFVTPAPVQFTNPSEEGLPGQFFGGVRVRSAAIGVPARVTVA